MFAPSSSAAPLFPTLVRPLADDAHSIDFENIDDHAKYFYQYVSESKLCLLWPARLGTHGARTWTLDELFVFLNELRPNCAIHDSGRFYKFPPGQKKSSYFQFTFDLSHFVRAIKIRIPNKCTHCVVRISKQFVANPPSDWLREESGCRPHFTGRPLLEFPGSMGILVRNVIYPSTWAILRAEPFLRIQPDDISGAFRYVLGFLCSKPHENDLAANPDKKIYIHYLASILQQPKIRIEHHTRSSFEQKMGGFLQLWVKARWQSDHLEVFNHEGLQMSIVSGCWIHPSAISILNHASENALSCLMLDTTWAIMAQYVTAILVAIAYNTAIPLGFSFGPVEDSNLYDIFFNVFRGKGVDLSNFRLMSDQGSGLCKFAKVHNFIQRFCLRHFLASLKDHMFACYVHYLVKAKTGAEFCLLRDNYRFWVHDAIRKIQSSGTGDGLKRAQNQFNKAGLTIVYIEGEELPLIEITDQARWEQISSITKVDEGLPTTTNSIEAINGHCNELTPRNNPFWSSMTRIVKMINRGIEYHPSSVRHNFNAAIRRAAGFVHIIGKSEMKRQQEFYATNVEERTCSCGSTSYLSRIYNSFIPCCHLLVLGVEKPRLINSPTLVRSNEVGFELVVVSAERDGEEPSQERKDTLIGIAAHAIKNLSKTGTKFEGVLEWVGANWPSEDAMEEFVCNIPVSVLTTISAGVVHFTSH
jgi:hypothetical protein